MQCVLEPSLIDHGCCGHDSGDIGIASEVVEDAERHDAQAVVGLEVFVRVADIFELGGVWIENLHIASQVAGAIMAREIVEGLIGDVGHLRYMLALYCLEQLIGVVLT